MPDGWSRFAVLIRDSCRWRGTGVEKFLESGGGVTDGFFPLLFDARPVCCTRLHLGDVAIGMV